MIYEASIVDLARAVADGRWNDVDELLARGTPIDARLPDSGETLLHIAVEARNPSFVRRLLEMGANVNAVNARGDTPLLVACRSDYPVETRLLLEHGADPNYENAGWSPLRCAARDRNTANVTILLSAGARVSAKTPDAASPGCANPTAWAAELDAFVRQFER